ncbi:MAG: phage tail protein [Cycloclasticus sp.]
MDKFEALQEFFIGKDIVPKGKFDCWVEGAETAFIAKDTPDGFHLLDFEYLAVFSFEDCKQHAFIVPALAHCWLSDHDMGRDESRLGRVKENITQESKGCYSIDLQIKFIEKVYIHQDDTGQIEYNGQMWTGGALAAAIVRNVDIKNT